MEDIAVWNLCVRACLFRRMHTYIHYIHTYTHAYIHTCIHTYIHTCIHTYIHTYMHACIHTYMLLLRVGIHIQYHIIIHTVSHHHTYSVTSYMLLLRVGIHIRTDTRTHAHIHKGDQLARSLECICPHIVAHISFWLDGTKCPPAPASKENVINIPDSEPPLSAPLTAVRDEREREIYDDEDWCARSGNLDCQASLSRSTTSPHPHRKARVRHQPTAASPPTASIPPAAAPGEEIRKNAGRALWRRAPLLGRGYIGVGDLLLLLLVSGRRTTSSNGGVGCGARRTC